ncbi:hypothetical protein LSH36_576g02000 [Paralvinella palmiformis]|uniref:Anion exchange protein n=1 Tax=Paralvinella palmiformis TaxID=53620 RepID=A0AAD9J5F6_9ANNE|nr:hypothetical protein LSH36_576g02000 [Paralvinella palmiformis]
MDTGEDSDQAQPVKDHGSTNYNPLEDEAISAHHTDRWQHQAMMDFPGGHKGKHRKRKHPKQPGKKVKSEPEPSKPATPPGERVKFLLGHTDDNDEDHQTHDIFCEMDELKKVGDDGEYIWKETARWIKFEEDVDEGGDRWSKPFVATLSLHSLFELRKGLLMGTVMLDVDAMSLVQIIEMLADHMVATDKINVLERDKVVDILLTRHRHQHEKKHHEHAKGLPFVRSLADIGKKSSEKKLEGKDQLKKSSSGSHLAAGKNGSSFDSHKQSHTDISESGSQSQFKYNQHYAKKIPHGAEVANILVGEVDFLKTPVMAFLRLSKAVVLGELTEVPVGTRFLFILLGPKTTLQNYREIGRSIATLMSDEVFHDVAYKARHREDILAGLDEFLEQVTVLPPGEWDPTIRIEPPKSVPSQAGRKKDGGGDGVPNGLVVVEQEEEGHADPTLERTGKPFGGLVNDIKRKIPWYLSDFRDGVALQCLASFGFIYFACLTPIITFGGLLGLATDNHLAAMESLVSGAVCGITYHLFSGQPLTIIGSTGPVLVFETIVYQFCVERELNYLALRFWIGMWVALFLFIMVVFDLSALVKYITRFTEESFAMLIALIFVVEAFKKLFHILQHAEVDNLDPDTERYCHCEPNLIGPSNDTHPIMAELHVVLPSFMDSPIDMSSLDWQTIKDEDVCTNLNGHLVGNSCHLKPDVFFFSCLLFIGTFILSMALKSFRNTRFLPSMARSLVSDFSVFMSILIMLAADYFVGLSTPKLLVPEEFRPTRPDRGWIVNPFDNPVWVIPAAFLPSLLATILIFMDQQITAVIINRKENKLRKGGGYHLDLTCITIQIIICSLIGTPWFVAATVLSINHVHSLTRLSETSAPGERPKFLGVRENRLTGTLVFVLIGLSALMAKILSYIPMPVLYGVFLFMGVSSLKGIQLMQRFLILFMPQKYQPDYMFLRQVRLRRVHLFTFIQVVCLACLWTIKMIKMVSIIFPLMVLAMCFVRKALDWVFTRHELKWLDDIMPEAHKREKEERKKKLLEAQEEQLIEMSGGLVIPLSEGRSIQIPADSIRYDPVTKKLQVNDPMSQSDLWHQLKDTSPSLDQYTLRSRKPSKPSSDDPKSSTVKFSLSDESNPEIVVDPPSKNASTEDCRV